MIRNRRGGGHDLHGIAADALLADIRIGQGLDLSRDARPPAVAVAGIPGNAPKRGQAELALGAYPEKGVDTDFAKSCGHWGLLGTEVLLTWESDCQSRSLPISASLCFRGFGFLLAPDAGEGGLDLLLEAGDELAVGVDKGLFGLDLGDDG